MEKARREFELPVALGYLWSVWAFAGDVLVLSWDFDLAAQLYHVAGQMVGRLDGRDGGAEFFCHIPQRIAQYDGV
jgi:hypothetical protein